jgi:hypothetical protein
MHERKHKNFEKTQKKENDSRFASKRENLEERKKERKKEKESANATTRIILLSIARYHNHLLCANVIFHYSN